MKFNFKAFGGTLMVIGGVIVVITLLFHFMFILGDKLGLGSTGGALLYIGVILLISAIVIGFISGDEK